MDDLPADPVAPSSPSAGGDVDEAVSAELESTRALLGDAGTVIVAREQLDGLLLDALVAPGLAPAALTRLREFISGDALPRAHTALTRLSAAGFRPGEQRKRPFPIAFISASARMERAELPVQRKRTLWTTATMLSSRRP